MAMNRSDELKNRIYFVGRKGGALETLRELVENARHASFPHIFACFLLVTILCRITMPPDRITGLPSELLISIIRLLDPLSQRSTADRFVRVASLV